MSMNDTADPKPEDLFAPSVYNKDPNRKGKTAVIRTSDRIAFKKCRRKWAWNSHLKANLGPKEAQNPLWFGTAMHFALEDYHGYNYYGSPTKAFKAYCQATWACRKKQDVPATFDELKGLGVGMMEYYEEWLEGRDPLQTLIWDGKPQVEVRVHLEVPFNVKEMYPDSPYDRVVYSLTIDRVVEDPEDGDLWLLDYKSAKQMATTHFLTDPQIGVYYWAGHHVYPGRRIKGFIYQQHLKDFPDAPKITAKGKLSTDSRQRVTHRSYRKAITDIYGKDSKRWPAENLDFLNELAIQETPDADKFVRRDRIYRNEYSHEAEGAKILMELEDMLNPNLPLYPNPTRDCVFMCPFMHACISMDDGSNWAEELEMMHQSRSLESEEWRDHLPKPDEVK